MNKLEYTKFMLRSAEINFAENDRDIEVNRRQYDELVAERKELIRSIEGYKRDIKLLEGE